MRKFNILYKDSNRIFDANYLEELVEATKPHYSHLNYFIHNQSDTMIVATILDGEEPFCELFQSHIRDFTADDWDSFQEIKEDLQQFDGYVALEIFLEKKEAPQFWPFFDKFFADFEHTGEWIEDVVCPNDLTMKSYTTRFKNGWFW